ncbi:MAG: Stp1/IreP family PP2C-type Ser/Thr phosphatase [candidate division Zixibacteria bacterium]|nr:Stp1/IreP family PP2C-type Ser/Thr phosphatase [candidate division Zixibacteria bacterium]
MQILYAGGTDVGKVRDHNEDSYAILTEQNLVMVCDGMGGHAAGEVASQLAVETITTIIKEHDLGLFTGENHPYPEELTPEGKLLVGAIAVANQRIIDRAKQSSSHTGMGTTIVACHFRDGVASICHVGDSRAYLIRNGSIKRVTIDHSWISEVMEKHHLTEEESENLVNRNVITRALGTRTAVRTDISQIRFAKGDTFLLCSDGLCGLVSDTDILKAATSCEEDLSRLVQELTAKANEAGGNDNITLVVAKVVDQEEISDFDEVRRVTIDWNEDNQIARIAEVIAAKFPPEPEIPSAPAGDTTNFSVPTPRERGISPVLWIIISIVVLAAIAFIIFK